MDKRLLLCTEELRAGYGGKEILHGISVGFESGKVTVIAGPNGCGKSTLLKTIIRITPASGGRVLADGRDTSEMTAAELARHIAYLPQKKNIPDLTVMTMVLHGRFAHLSYPRRYRKEDIAAAEEALRITELTELADENMSRLSGGTQQRAFLAMALAQSSPVILMDEPASFMDISYQLKLMELSRRLADSGKAVVMVLHDLPAALKYADEIIVMSEGNTAAAGTPDEVFESGVLDRVFGIQMKRTVTENGIVYYCR
ncbi:MAG: ABC transporter ATP-binding protein [Ruminococcus sp.]|nr:ABC transporter ATP-binding protein [Ruminococcus sp.]